MRKSLNQVLIISEINYKPMKKKNASNFTRTAFAKTEANASKELISLMRVKLAQ
jgi:hypothetical protein